MPSSVDGVREAKAAIAALKVADREVRSELLKATRTTVNPIWKEEVNRGLSTADDKRVLSKGVRVAVSARDAQLKGANTNEVRGGRWDLADGWKAVEFGAKRNELVTYRRKGHKVTRHVKRHLPNFKKGGRVLYPATGRVAPRIASLYAQTVIRLYLEAFEKGTR